MNESGRKWSKLAGTVIFESQLLPQTPSLSNETAAARRPPFLPASPPKVSFSFSSLSRVSHTLSHR